MDQLRFSVPEILSLIGVTQCVYVLVYMMFRSGDAKRAALPFFYFLIVGAAFFLDFGNGYIAGSTMYYPILQWFFWFMGPPLSVLLIVQIARIHQLPALGNYWVLFLTPLAYAAAVLLSVSEPACIFPDSCEVLNDWLVITGLVAGAVSLVAIWLHRGMLDELYADKAGKDRYWLVLTLILVNVFFLGLMLLSLSDVISAQGIVMVRTFLGLGLVYLAGTSLFRIYPRAVTIVSRHAEPAGMTDDETALAKRIERLLDYDKIYHEPAYGRAELARELEIPETVVSKIINMHFGKSFPQLLNERRVEDAKRLLVETGASVKIVAEEVGFNSTASFNRVFRELTGASPSVYRAEHAKK